MSRALEELVGTMWRLEDTFFGDMRFVIVEVIPDSGPEREHRDVRVLDCQSGETVYGWYDPDQRFGVRCSHYETIVCGVKKDGKSLGPQYLLPIET
jgi:hypothetical protein